MSLFIITLVTLVVGIGSVLIADLLVTRAGAAINNQDSYVQQGFLCLAAGALLATSFTHLLPEAFESNIDTHQLFLALLIGLVFFFLLNKAELWHHGHEHNHSHEPHTTNGWSLLLGDGVHCFGDGILIASIFIVDIHLGLIAAASVLVHEVPHHMGDLVVLRQKNHRSAAVLKLTMAGAMTALGGLSGYFLLAGLQQWQPFLMILASSSFIYVSLSDLIPQLQQRWTTKDTIIQILWLFIGILIVTLINRVVHGAH